MFNLFQFNTTQYNSVLPQLGKVAVKARMAMPTANPRYPRVTMKGTKPRIKQQ